MAHTMTKTDDEKALEQERDRAQMQQLLNPAATTAVAVRSTLDVDERRLQEVGKLLGRQGWGCTEVQVGVIARAALAYGLDPLMGELIPLGGKPYVTIEGRLRKANEHPQFDGIECRPATEEERKAFRCRDDEDLWLATVWRKDRRVPYTNWGRCSSTQESVIGRGSELVPNTIARRWSQEVAQKRAKHRALRDAFAMPLPGAEEQPNYETPRYEQEGVIEGEVVQRPASDEPVPNIVVDMETGENRYLIRTDQTKAVHAIVSGLKWSDDTYRELLRATFAVSSSQDLTEAQAAALLETLKAEEDHLSADLDAAELRALSERIRGGRPASEVLTRRDDLADDVPPRQRAAEAEEVTDPVEPPNAHTDAAIEGEFSEASSEETESEQVAAEPPTAKERDFYRQLLGAASKLGLDLMPFEVDLAAVSRDELLDRGKQLRAAVTTAQTKSEQGR